MCRHGAVSGLIRIIGIKAHGLCPCLELADLPVGIFGIILSDISLQPGRIEDGHGSLITINFLKDRLSQVHEGIEEQLQVIDEFLLEPGDFRSIENSSRRILAGP